MNLASGDGDAYSDQEQIQDDQDQEQEEESDELSQEDSWQVIRAFFDEKGLVRQQLDSFNEFVSNTMQELVEEVRTLTMEQASQHTEREEDTAVSLRGSERERERESRCKGGSWKLRE